MAVFQGAVDTTCAAFGIDAVNTPAGGDPLPVRVIARCPDAIVGFGEDPHPRRDGDVRAARERGRKPRQGDQLTVGGETFVVQGEPDRRDPGRLV